MSHHNGHSPLWDSVVPLALAEQAVADPDILTRLMIDEGEARTEQIVSEALDAIASDLSLASDLWHAGTWFEVGEPVARLQGNFARLGLHGPARVAGDVATALDQNDQTALSATLARLFRIGPVAMSAIFQSPI